MCLLETLWILFRQRIWSYPRCRREKQGESHRSVLNALPESYLVSPPAAPDEKGGNQEEKEEVEVVEERSPSMITTDITPIAQVVDTNDPPSDDIWGISQGLFAQESPIGLDIDQGQPTFFQHQIGPYNYYTIISIPTLQTPFHSNPSTALQPPDLLSIANKPKVSTRDLQDAVDNNTMGIDLCRVNETCLPASVVEDETNASNCDETESGVLCSTHSDDDDDVLDSSDCCDSYGDDADCYADDNFNIQELPVEIIHHIFSFLTLPQLCHHVAPVCQRWRHLAADPVHWQRLMIGPSVTSTHLCKCIRRAPMLRTLCLHWRTDLTLAEVNLFAISCPLLQDLNLSYCDNINNMVLDIISEHCHNLTCINLEGCRMVDTSSIHYITKFTKLRSVFLSHCASITTEGIELLSKNLKHLEKLNIDGIPDIKDSAIKMIVAFHGDHLRMLCVDGAALSDAAFGAISQCRMLVTLCVSFGELLTDYTLEYIQHVCTLRTLRLCKCGGFTLEGLVNLFSLKMFTALVHLDLSDCINLHDSGIHSIVNCCGHSLRQLYLCWCWYITDTGLQDIVVNCVNMEVLDLMGLCDIGGNCLVLLPTTMPRLRLLDLSQCHQVTDELLVDVVAKLPNLVVFNYYGEKIQYCPQTGRRKHRLHRCTVTN